MTSRHFLTGQFLLAMPGMPDPRFDRAVIAMCAHDADGAMGVGIGAEIDGLGVHEILEQFGIDPGTAPDAPVNFGGPVEPGRGFVLHSSDWGGQGTIDVAGRWSLSGTIDVLRAIAEGRGPSQWVIALGYAGWGGGQLDGEMTRHGWLCVEATPALIFATPAADRWERAMASAGVDTRFLSSEAGRA